MKKTICWFLCVFALFFVACGSGHKTNAIELMGAGDQIHDSYTFANNGVTISRDNNTYLIGGSVDKLTDEAVKQEFEIADSVTHVVAIKLTAVESDVVKDEVEIDVEAVRVLFKKRDEVFNSQIKQAKKAFERIKIDFGDEEDKQETINIKSGSSQN